MLLFRIGDTPGPKIDLTSVGEEVELVALVRPVLAPSRVPAYQISSTHSGWSMNGFRLCW